MNEYPAIVTSGKLSEFLSEIQGANVPERFSQELLKTMGYKSSNDRPLIPMLKMLGFIDGGGRPTDLYKQYRDKTKCRFVLADGVRRAYSELFAIFPDAYNKDVEALKNFFRPRTDGGEDKVNVMAQTFRDLVALADFSNGGENSIASIDTPEPSQASKVALGRYQIVGSGQAMTLNINIQLTLPESKDPEVYNSLFAALRKHLLDREKDN